MTTINKEAQFMKSPLASWVKTFDETILSVKDLADGVIFNKIMHEVDPNTYGMSRVAQAVCDEPSLRLQNLQLVVNCVKHFYMLSQKQLVITSLPEVTEIAHEPAGDKSLDELEKLIILLLGCTIHSENNQQLIAHITKNMEPEHQHTLIFYIQKITDSTEFVCNFDWSEFGEISKPDLEALCRTAYVYLQRVAKERDYLFDTVVETTQERDFYKDQQNRPASASVSPYTSPQVQPELIELKKQARALHEDIERKNDQLAEQEDELKQTKLALQKLQHEKMELIDEAKSARAYRDEVETLRVQSAKAEKLENEVIKYRQKIEDVEYLKKRVLELKQQNELMSETKSLLEQKVISLTSRSDMLDEAQVEIASVKAQVESLHQEKQMDMERIEELVAQTARYELENKTNQEQIIQLTAELKTERDRVTESLNASNSETSLSFEMSEASLTQKAKLVRLEKEKREMEKAVETARHMQAKVAELEKTNKKFYTQSHSDKKEIIKLKEEVEVLKVKASRVDKLQSELSSQRDKLEDVTRMQSRLKEWKARNESVMEAKAMLEDQLEDLQGKVDLLDVVQKENAQLKAQMDSINMESSEDHKRIQELMEQNAQLDLENQRCNKKINDLTMELDQRGGASPSSSTSKLSVMSSPARSESDIASKAKIQRLEKELVEYESAKESLRHCQAKVAELEKTTKKMNKQAHADKREMIRLKEELEVYKTKTSRLERRRSVKMSQSEPLDGNEINTGKLMELKQQNTLILESKVMLEEEVNSLRKKLTNLSDLQSENAVLKVRLNNLEQEAQDETQRMQDLLQENAQLELLKERNANDIENLKRELDKLRMAATTGNSSDVPFSPVGTILSDSDLATRAKLLRMERDYNELQYDFDMFKKRSERAANELENTNKKLNTQIHNGKKEIVLLKETLKHEKQLNDKLNDQVNQLQRAALNASNATDGDSGVSSNEGSDNIASDHKKIHELGTKLDEAHSQSLAIKEERINQLEKRLEELRNENSSLKETIRKNEQGISTAAAKIESKYKEKSALLSAQVTDQAHIIEQFKQRALSVQDRLEMFEQLNQTLEEEKKTLLLQVNRLLEQNQGLLMRTLEDRDQELEEERVYSDRLNELEREKTLLAEKLKTQEREAMYKEMEIIKRREKKRNPLKQTMKKIKGKFQKGRTHTFNEDHGPLNADPTFSPRTSYLYSGGGDSSPRSSNQSLSSNSRHSDSYDEVEGGGSAPDVNSAGYVPRNPTSNTTPNPAVVLRQRKTQSMYNPPVKQFTKIISSPSLFQDDKADVLSLQEFLEEANKTPNRRKMMEIKRASVITTPDITPRNSMLFGINQISSQMDLPDQLELQDFLRNFHRSDDTMSIPEVEDDEDHTQSEDEEADDIARATGSITPSDASRHSTKAFELPMNNANSNNNNNSTLSGSGRSSLERLIPVELSPPMVVPLLTTPTRTSPRVPCSYSFTSDISYHSSLCEPQPQLTTPGSHHVMVDSEKAEKLKKLKMYSSSVDLPSSNKIPNTRRDMKKTMYKSSDNLDDVSSVDSSTSESGNSSWFKLKALSFTKSKGEISTASGDSKENRRKLFGSRRNSKTDKNLGLQHHQVTTVSSSSPSSRKLNQPPSVKNKIASSVSVVV